MIENQRRPHPRHRGSVRAYVRAVEHLQERRRRVGKRAPPAQAVPTLNVEEVLSGRFQSNFESYTLDQFPLRDELRTLKALSVRDLFGEKDNNGIYVADGYAAKLDDTIHEDSLDHAADRFRYVYETYLKDTGVNVYLSVIPDKNYLFGRRKRLSRDGLREVLCAHAPKGRFCGLYRPDGHAVALILLPHRPPLAAGKCFGPPRAKALADAMGVSLTVDFTEVTLDTPFLRCVPRAVGTANGARQARLPHKRYHW